ncbi:nicotinate-nucleotide--dimethylbenzimidazole phosphoribosyltransferase [Vibrio scophthalmi]|uniref:nicotinate-nucleotide--dimethylbenzimidazole phosphoribosyltransferase n=1 Tax=Vibrio scophthalmi TaxID=45658 RepID=UPI002284737D|nr:nicotinate-nucleotide--dimethylbenzimidazole phosphoribosyltransferase [Vibrio scophthalmi]MCY9805585.1 nicotinate-nucleotide--dimethylbenzimidazole phosphoribosyltransferase [Vibrio scophthalmi]
MLDKSHSDAIWQQINNKTKPLGSLGKLEQVAHKLAMIQGQGKGDVVTKIKIKKPTVIVFAGDHGIAREGVSIAPQEVTQQMVKNFLAGGAAVNCFCRTNDVDLLVVDAGMVEPIKTDSSLLVEQRLGTSTENFAHKPAMTKEQVEQGLAFGDKIVKQVVDSGSNLIMFGEMGIGNTSSAAAILAALSRRSVEKCVGLGTGINDQQLRKKRQFVQLGVNRCRGQNVQEILRQVGGFEIAQMVGAFLAAEKYNTPVIVDGFIATAAAYVAAKINPACREYMIFAHQSHESGHKFMLQELAATPLFDLALRLGEGTGAVLAVPLIRSAAEFYNHMASFDQAGVEM